jgi:D-beta-D-heptose 7-phosphate kinase/D-beta-D-heptose 1-phosphate adenosyltransferase
MKQRTVFTNGCFDIIHRGHLELLKYCRSLGGKVVIGLNSDKSVRGIKGKNRPINNQEDRKFLLESLRYVDKVIIFDEDTPASLIKETSPDIIVKGGDYEAKPVVGSDLATVLIFQTVDGYSTTKTIQSLTGGR